jgi:hypothetical protein
MGAIARVVIVAIAATGCRQILGIDDLDPIVPGQPDAPTCGWNALNIDSCLLPAPVDVVLPAGAFTYSTDLGEFSDGMTTIEVPVVTPLQADGSELHVASIGALVVPAGTTLAISGHARVVFAVDGAATIDGTIDVRPSSELERCSESQGDARAGGGGGGNGASGGAGGDAVMGGQGGAAIDSSLEPLHGGCFGSRGGMASSGAGVGGAAFELTARGRVVIAGEIDAGGDGGQGGGPGVGGGGGGAGGSIVVDGDVVEVFGYLCANGAGGGGGGAMTTVGGEGLAGDCSIEGPLGGSAGGAGGGDGGRGGGLAIQGGRNGSPAMTSNAGGGGGGGGVGKIRIRGRNSEVIAPQMITPPPLAP